MKFRPPLALLHTFTMREEKKESQSCITPYEKLQFRKRPRRYKLWLGLGAIAFLAATALVIAICLTLSHQRKRDNGSYLYVDLGYSRYSGKSFKDGTTQWLGMRYAAPPVGNLRFAAPQDPLRNATIQAANGVSEALITCAASFGSCHAYHLVSTVLDASQRKIISATAQSHQVEAKIVYLSMSTHLQMLEIIPQSFLFTSSFKGAALMTTLAQMMLGS